MAKGLNMPVNLKFNTAQAKADLRELQQTLNQITTAQHSNLGITSEIKEAIGTAEILKKTLKDATSIGTGQLDLSKFTQAMNQNMMTIEKFKSSLQSLGPEGEKVFNNLAINIAKAQAPVQRTNAMFGELKNAFANSMRWSITSGVIRKVTQEVQKAFNYAQNLDKSLNSIRIVTGHNTEYMSKFADQANKAARALSASTLEYTNASLIYYQQGLSDKEVQKRAETTIKLSKVSGESAQQVSQQLTAVWNNFSNGVDNLERYADVMANLGAHTASSSKEIAKGLEKFAAISHTIGLSYDYAATALATVTAQTRQSADQVGTSFKTLFSRLESLKLGDTLEDGVGLSKYSEALLKVGVNVLDVNGQLRDMDSILNDLGNRWNSLNQAQQVALAQTIGGVRNYTQLIALMDNWETFQENLITAQTAEGTLQKQAEIYAESWEAAKQRVQTSMQGLYSSIISSDFFKGLNNLTSNLLNSLGSIGKALGSSGSFSGLFMLGSRIYKDQFINGVNNLENNLFAGRQLGIDYQRSLYNTTVGGLQKQLGETDSFIAKRQLEAVEAVKSGYSTYDSTNASNLGIGRQAFLNFQASQIEQGLNREIDIARQIQDTEAGIKAKALLTTSTAIPEKSSPLLISSVTPKTPVPTYASQVEAITQANLKVFREGQVIGAQEQIIRNVADIVSRATGENTSLTTEEAEALIQAEALAYSKTYGTAYAESQSEASKLETGDAFQRALYSGSVEDSELIAVLRKSIIERTEKLSEEDQKLFDQGKIAGGQKINAAGFSERAKSGHYDKTRDEDLKPQQVSFGQAAYDTSMMLNSINMLSNSFTNLVQKTKEGTASFGDVTTTIGSLGMAAATTSKVFKNVTEVSGPLAQSLGKLTMMAGAEKGGKLVGATGGLTGAGFGMYAAIAAAAVGIGVAAYKVWDNNQLDTKIERANESQIYTAAKAKEDKQKYDSFYEVAKQQNDSVNKLYSLQKGTAAYNSQLLTANEQARTMIDTYNLEADRDYTLDSSGIIHFSQGQIEAINNRLEEQALVSSSEASVSSSVFNYLNLAKQLEKIQGTYSTEDATYSFDTRALGEQKLNGQISEQEYETRREALDANYQQYLNTVSEEEAKIKNLQDIEYSMGLTAALAQNKNVDALDQVATIIATEQGASEQFTAKLSAIDNLVRTQFGGYLNEEQLKQQYSKTFNGQVADADWTQEQIAEAILAKEKSDLFEGIISDIKQQFAGHEDELRTFYKENKDYSIATVKEIEQSQNYKTLLDQRNEFIEELQNQNTLLAEAEARGITTRNKTNEQIQEEILKNADLNDFSVLSSINLINSSIKSQIGSNIDNLLQTLVHFNISTDEQLKVLQQLKSSDLQLLNSYVGNYGASFGDKTAKFIYENLLSGNGINTLFLKELQSLGASNSIQALAAIEQRRDLLRSQSGTMGGDQRVLLNNTLENLVNAMQEDIADRGGLAKTLFTSSEFQDVFTSLTGAVRQGTKLTSENLVNLAKKNETLNSYLSLNGVTSQGLANLITSIGQGRLNVGQVTDSLAQAYFTAGGAASAQQEGLSTLEEQDLGTSYSELNKYYQNGGKAWYTAWTNNMMNDAPLMNFLGSFLTNEDYLTYLDILNEASEASKDAKWIKDQVKSRLSYAYEALDTWQGKGRKKQGKGGGGFADMWVYLKQSGVLDGTGLEINEDNGNIRFGDAFATEFPKIMAQLGRSSDVTTENLTTYLAQILQNNNKYDFFQARTLSKQMIGDMASSAMGNLLSAFDLEAGANQWFQDLLKEGIVNQDVAQAYFEAYRQGFGNLSWDGEKWVQGEGTNANQFIDALNDLGIKISELDESDFTGKNSISLDELGAAIRGESNTGWGNKTNEQVVLDYLNTSNIKQYEEGVPIISNGDIKGYDTTGIAFDLKDTIENFTASGMSSDLIKSTIEQLYNKQGQDFVFQKKDIFGNISNIGTKDFNNFDDFYNAYLENESNNGFTQAMTEHMYQKAMQAVDDRYEGTKGPEEGWEVAYQAEFDRMKQQAAAKNQGPTIYTEIPSSEIQPTTGTGTTSTTQETPEKQSLPQKEPTKEEIVQQLAAEGVTQADIDQSKINAKYYAANGIAIPERDRNLIKYEQELLAAVENIDANTDTIATNAEEDSQNNQGDQKNKKNNGEKGSEEDQEEDQGIEMPEAPAPSGGGSGGGGSGGGGGGSGGIFAGMQANGQDGKGNPIFVDNNGQQWVTDGEGGKVEYVPEEQKASGQNNNILKFASGLDNFIAVTGELGPELRIKSDGSMDILGQHGREYTWVNPDDKIYTAAQTASILGNKTINELQGLAKGINNFIPGFASASALVGIGTDRGSSSGGGWSPSRPSALAEPAAEEDHRYDPNWLQYRDVIERYYTILQQIENITNAVTRFSEIADRAWGKERQKALTETIKLQEQQIEAQKKYVSEIQTYFKGDRNTLTTMMQEFVDAFNEANPNSHLTFEGAEFDENGVLTNYRAFAETLVDQFNEKQAFKDKKEQYKFQEQLKDIQQYTETLNLLEEQETQLAKLEEALFDARLNEIQVVLEYKMSLDQNQQTLIDYALSKVKDDAYAAAEAVALIGEKQQILVEQLGDYEQAVRDILAVNQGGGRGINGVGLQLVDSNVGLALQSEFDDLKKWRDTFYDEETGEYKETAKIKDEISGKEVEHKWKEYSELLEKYYREYWNMYSDVLPDPDEFLNWTDTDDADKKIIENYEAVYNRLEQLQNQLNKSKIEYTYDKFTGILENSDEVTEQVQKHYEELLETYPQLTDAIKEMDAALIDESTGRLNAITQYANLVNIINKINEVTKGQLSDEQYQLFLNNPQEFADWLMNPFENPDATPLTNAEVEQMQGYISSMLSNLTSIQSNLYDVIDKMGDSAKAYFKDINSYLDKFDHYKDLYKNWANIIDLSGRAATQVDHELMSGLYMKVTDNYINKLKGAKKAFGEAQDELKAAQDLYNERLNALNAYVGDDESIKQQYQNLFNQAEENLNNMYKIYTDAENNYYSSWEDALQGLADSFKEVIQNAAKNFEASFSPLFTTLELLQNAYDRQKELKDLYVDSYQQAHDLSKLNRDLANSIIDTDNLQGKQKLRDMQKEINKLQESGVKLSQYDLDVLQKKYDLELARQELEDAKNAKSLVRLARDNNGNWSYVYTASEDDVAAAEQKYEDAVLAMEQANEEYINNLQDQLFQVLQDAEAQIQALDPSQFQTEEDFNRAVQAIRDATVEKVNFINQQMNNALGNNNYLLDNVTGRARDLLDGLTSDYGDTILAMTSGMDDLTAFTALTIDNVDELASRTVVAFSDFWNRIGEVWQEAGHDILQAPTELSGAIKDIGEASSTTMEDISTAVDKASDAFDRLTESITTFFDSLDLDHLTEMISYYENWSQSLTDFIEYMGDWEQETGILKFNGDITQWGQMNQIYKILQDYGTAMLQYIDENGNTVQKELIAGSEETQAWLQQQREKIVTELANYKDLTTLTFDSQKKLDKAIDAINDKLNNQGLMNIDIKGDVFTKLKDEGVLDDFANMVIARDNDKKTATIQLDKVQNLDQVNAFLEKLEEVMKVKPPSGGGGGYFGDPFAYLQMAVAWMRDNHYGNLPAGNTYHTAFGNIGFNTGGYTGNWQSADTGMYTGEWPNGSVRANGRLAWLHQKELVLNAHDTENFLNAMEIVRQLDNLANWMANGLGDIFTPTIVANNEPLEQNVHIEASFPNVTNHSEIEQAFDNLVNLASQYANRK